MQSPLLGMNAHIDYDLAFAVAVCWLHQTILYGFVLTPTDFFVCLFPCYCVYRMPGCVRTICASTKIITASTWFSTASTQVYAPPFSLRCAAVVVAARAVLACQRWYSLSFLRAASCPCLPLLVSLCVCVPRGLQAIGILAQKYAPALQNVSILLGKLDDVLFALSLRATREVAWHNAEALVMARKGTHCLLGTFIFVGC